MSPVQSAVGYCACGAEIWIEYLHGAEGWFCRFSDPEGREVQQCPSCGRPLDEDGLLPR
ncbi:MAG: hypothetical protein K9K66_03590 [Desulfarculaceae bacterium]|nr:hypothetical protein [Desulfarculaceae bacterium]MCF8072984.1 hypothetical protein [Desulfarculaceae bacterium]MCF8100720.1 hypothetical protein [Desulfarculaceae bacterium]MCF8115458.1 hypothetical protein [Desulfarculaceae bacterium]